MTKSATAQPFVETRLRKVVEGQVLRLADDSFADVAKHHRRRLVHLDLEAEDGAPATLIGVPRARVKRRKEAVPSRQ